jgi:hypothetical protein
MRVRKTEGSKEGERDRKRERKSERKRKKSQNQLNVEYGFAALFLLCLFS